MCIRDRNRGGDAPWLWHAQLIERARKRLASMIRESAGRKGSAAVQQRSHKAARSYGGPEAREERGHCEAPVALSGKRGEACLD